MKLKILKFGLWRFETIYEVMKEINSYYGVHDTAKIAVLKIICDKLKLPVGETKVEAEFNIALNTIIDRILASCEKMSKDMGGDSVSMAYLRNAIDVVKHSFKEGALKAIDGR